MLTKKTNQNIVNIIIFGVTGDLYKNKLSLALFNLFKDGLLPEKFNIIGFARKPFTQGEFLDFTKACILNKAKGEDANIIEEFLGHIKYFEGNLDNLASFIKLKEELLSLDKDSGLSNKLFYLSIPPSLYGTVFKNLNDAKLIIKEQKINSKPIKSWTRILIEKPFGENIKEAKVLMKILKKFCNDFQIFNIDHYLMKKSVQDIFYFHHTSPAMDMVLNNKNVRKVKIALHEKNNLEFRGAFYDKVGAFLDVGQNHLLQMLAIFAMEKPNKLSSDKVQKARFEILQKTQFASLSDEQYQTIRAQYTGYSQEKNVSKDTTTETFFRVYLKIDNKKWSNVIFELESGKALSTNQSYIEVFFKNLDASLKFNISPNIFSKKDAYEKVFHDALIGEQSFFVSFNEIIRQWVITKDVIKKIQKTPMKFYVKNSNADDIK